MSNVKGSRLKELVIGYAEAAGLTVLGVERTGGNHQRMKLRLPNGQETSYILPWSPSDNGRGQMNLRADMRRLARTGNVRGQRSRP